MSGEEPVKILLVDDQPAKLLSYEAILGELGETLIKATSARDALAELLKNDVAVVLIDVQMPDLDGFELAAMIREHPRFEQTALIFVSAIHLSDLDRVKGYEAGAVDYVPVPVIPEVLRAKVRVFADLHRKTRQLERWNGELERRVEERTAALEASRAELQEVNRKLEERVVARTREREQAMAQLFEAQKMDTIGQLTGGVAHDFNNLLMAMFGSLELLKKRMKDDPKTQELIENALKGAERGASLTQRLLAFARRQELRREALSIPELVSSFEELLSRTIGPGISLKKELAPDLPPILGDANQLELAMLNLALNARDAMPGGGTLTISARAVSVPDEAAGRLRPGAYVSLSVEDTGHGMDEATQARAAEPFFTTKGLGKGTGLGLSMVHGLAGQLGGALLIESAPGVGTKVELVIPRAEAPAMQPAAAGEDATEAAGRRATVLLVDDDALVSMGTAAMLEDLGHAVLTACSPIEALEVLEASPAIDLVITDYAMPGMNGLELARLIRKTHPALPILLATGYADLAAADRHSVLPRLSKPFRQQDLATAVAQQCFGHDERRRGGRPGALTSGALEGP